MEVSKNKNLQKNGRVQCETEVTTQITKNIISNSTRFHRQILLLHFDPQPCFAPHRSKQDFYNQIWFSHIRFLCCLA